MAKDLFNRYIWLVDTIYRAGKITLEEINERWLRTEMSGGVEIPLRTFHNHRKAIEEIFDINIGCNRRGGYYYYIENLEDMERSGLLERRPSKADRRTGEVHLTDQGRRALQAWEERCLDFETQMLEGFSEAEKKQLRDFLERAYRNVGGRP